MSHISNSIKNNKPAIRIIRATAIHAAAIAGVGAQAFSDTFGPLFSSKQELNEYLDLTYTPDKIRNSIRKESNVLFVALADERPVGFVKLKKNSLNQQIDSLAQTELQKIYVLKEFHGTGAGQGLMQAAIDTAVREKSEHLWLDTYVGNERGIHFYEKNGFVIHGKHFFTIGTQTFEYHVMDLVIPAFLVSGAEIMNQLYEHQV
jgi:diamine N-acetyltransferase